MAQVIVERVFEEPMAVADVQAMEDAATKPPDAHGVRLLTSYLSIDRRRMVCVYEAPDVESVRRVQRDAGLPFESIWGAEVYEVPQ